ncbi:MAG: HD-GYP domain-containing protein [Actinobacteria bacterium]|nr:HD-GYP domain-containing protein [Actinomycetota bacterium]
MTIGLIDLAAALSFLGAFGIALYALIAVRDRVFTAPAAVSLGVCAVLATVCVGNALNNLDVTHVLHDSEEYFEILFTPLIVYMMYGMYNQSQRTRVELEHGAADRLGRRLAESLSQLGEQRLDMLKALSAAVDAKDHYTALHSLHVADYSCAIAYRLGIHDDLQQFEQAGLLHDIGKIGVPDAVLLKPAHLTEPEYAVVKQHVTTASNIVGTIPFLEDIVPAILHHHERWDGKGYPNGLKGDAIPLAARVLAVADAFDAMTTDRPYRKAMPVDVARWNMTEGRGGQFDPRVVDAMLDLLDESLIAVESLAATA